MRSLGFGPEIRILGHAHTRSRGSGANLGSDHVFLIVKMQVFGRRLRMEWPLAASDLGHV